MWVLCIELVDERVCWMSVKRRRVEVVEPTILW